MMLALLGAGLASADELPEDAPLVFDKQPILDVRVVRTCVEERTGNGLPQGLWMDEDSAVASARYQFSIRHQLEGCLKSERELKSAPNTHWWWMLGGLVLGAAVTGVAVVAL